MLHYIRAPSETLRYTLRYITYISVDQCSFFWKCFLRDAFRRNIPERSRGANTQYLNVDILVYAYTYVDICLYTGFNFNHIFIHPYLHILSYIYTLRYLYSYVFMSLHVYVLAYL